MASCIPIVTDKRFAAATDTDLSRTTGMAAGAAVIGICGRIDTCSPTEIVIAGWDGIGACTCITLGTTVCINWRALCPVCPHAIGACLRHQ